MAAFLDKGAIWRVKKESTYGESGITFTSTDTVEVISPSMDASTDLIDREILKNSLVKAQQLLGKETSSGSMGVEVVSLDTGALNGEVLYESGMGNKIAAVVLENMSATAGSNTSTVINVTASSGLNYIAGGALQVSFSDSADEYVVIRSISTDAITVGPALVGTPANVTDVVGLLSFTIAQPSTAAVSLGVQEYIENVANQITYTYHGVVVSDMTINFPVANIVKTDFSLAGASFDVATGVGDRAPEFFSHSPYIAKNMTFTYAGVAYAVEDLSMNIASDIYDVEALTTDGLTNKLVTAKSAVGGSFSLEYADISLFNIFQAGTVGELFGTVANSTTTMGLYAPAVSLTSAAKSIDSGIYKEAIDFMCNSSAAVTVDTEDAITLFFT